MAGTTPSVPSWRFATAKPERVHRDTATTPETQDP